MLQVLVLTRFLHAKPLSTPFENAMAADGNFVVPHPD
jgi:hypothetical protein